MADGFDISQLNDYQKELVSLAEKKLPNETKKFLKKQGKELTKKNKSVYNSKGIGEKTGNLRKGFKTGKVYKFNGALSIRAYNNSPHAHLIDRGWMWSPRGTKVANRLVRKGRLKEYREKFIPGFNFMKEAEQAFESGHYQDVEEFLYDLLDKDL